MKKFLLNHLQTFVPYSHCGLLIFTTGKRIILGMNIVCLVYTHFGNAKGLI